MSRREESSREGEATRAKWTRDKWTRGKRSRVGEVQMSLFVGGPGLGEGQVLLCVVGAVFGEVPMFFLW